MARNNIRRYVLTVILAAVAAFSFAESKQNTLSKHNLQSGKYSIEEAFLNGWLNKLQETEQPVAQNVTETASEQPIAEGPKQIPIEQIIDMSYPPTKDDIQQTMPVIMNNYVDGYLTFMSTKRLDFVRESVKRGSPYLAEMKSIFAEYNIPQDLVYLPVIESGFKNYAYSSAKAVGMWQFIPDTAKWIGMNVNSWIDERRDPIIACRYAAKYLKFLYDVFEDWYLVLAAYNHGGLNIKKEMKKIGSREYYDLVRTKATPAETRGYVPSLMAVLYMLKHCDKYEIAMPDNEMFVQNYDYISVPFMAQSHLIAKYSDMTVKEFNSLNPALNQGFTPDKKYKYQVRIPKNKKDKLVSNMEQLKKSSYSNYISYYVKSGDSLSSIAYRYGISMNVIMKINHIENANNIKINQRIYIPNTNAAVAKQSNEDKPIGTAQAQAASPQPKTTVTTHVVKSGETLSSIAYRYGVTIGSIRAANSIRNDNNIQIGQKLKITKIESVTKSAQPSPAVQTQTSSAPKTQHYITYYVKSGETLSDIAYNHNVKLSVLMQANNIANANNIKVNQKINIPTTDAKASSVETKTTQPKNETKSNTTVVIHTVKSGETLSSIAYKYGTKVNSIMTENNIKNVNNIKIGQKLKITGHGDVVSTENTAKPQYWAYYVKQGDSLSDIAYKYGVSLSTLMKINNISNANSIKVNQKIFIPNKA